MHGRNTIMNTRLFGLLFGLVSALSCSIICGTACDVGGPGECAGPGGPFGACDDHLAFLCLNDLQCMVTESGRMCVPGLSVAQFVDDEVAAECSDWLGGEVRCSSKDGRCVISCAEVPCEGGTVCDPSTKLCVHPE
jgi:hypothetical protein